MSLTHLPKLKLAEILAADAAIAALHDGKYSEAWTNLQCATELIRIYKAEPLVISHLVRIADANIATRAAWEFLQSDQWTDAQLAGLQAAWENMEFFNSTENAFSMERARHLAFFQRARASSYNRLYSAWSGSGTAATNSSQGFLRSTLEAAKHAALLDRLHFVIWKHSWCYDEEMFVLQEHAEALKAIRRVHASGAFAPAFRDLQPEIARIVDLHTNAAAHFILGETSEWIGKSLVKFAGAETGRRLLVTAIALKRFHLRHGNYPAGLEALVPEYLHQVPSDLMDGKPLRYRPTPDGAYLLYSVGEDGEDNKGDPTPMDPTNQVRNWLKGHDIVWPQPATAEEIAVNLPGTGPAKLPGPRTNAPTNTP